MVFPGTAGTVLPIAEAGPPLPHCSALPTDCAESAHSAGRFERAATPVRWGKGATRRADSSPPPSRQAAPRRRIGGGTWRFGSMEPACAAPYRGSAGFALLGAGRVDVPTQ